MKVCLSSQYRCQRGSIERWSYAMEGRTSTIGTASWTGTGAVASGSTSEDGLSAWRPFLEPGAPSGERGFVLARAFEHDLERLVRRLHVVLIELREFEAELRGPKARAPGAPKSASAAARSPSPSRSRRALGTRARSRAAQDRAIRDLARELERATALERARHPDQIRRRQELHRLAVETDQRGHADHVPGIVFDDHGERMLVAGAQKNGRIVREFPEPSTSGPRSNPSTSPLERDEPAGAEPRPVQAPPPTCRRSRCGRTGSGGSRFIT